MNFASSTAYVHKKLHISMRLCISVPNFAHVITSGTSATMEILVQIG